MHKGFTLIISIVTTSMLLLVSFILVNISLKQLLLAFSGRGSQVAFYAADSGIECALYWDTRNPNAATSAFDPSVSGSQISCNNTTISTGSQTVSTTTSSLSKIGGGGASSPDSFFTFNLPIGCAIVTVKKNGATTIIESRGYNTCGTSGRRYERGISIQY